MVSIAHNLSAHLTKSHEIKKKNSAWILGPVSSGGTGFSNKLISNLGPPSYQTPVFAASEAGEYVPSISQNSKTKTASLSNQKPYRPSRSELFFLQAVVSSPLFNYH